MLTVKASVLSSGSGCLRYIKVGMEMYLASLGIVINLVVKRTVQMNGTRVFLLKTHPRTTSVSCCSSNRPEFTILDRRVKHDHPRFKLIEACPIAALAIDVVNRYEFTLLFLRFAVPRDRVTLFVRREFGVAWAGWCRMFSVNL